VDHREQRLSDRGHQLCAAGQLSRDRDRVPERQAPPGLSALDAAGIVSARRVRPRLPGHLALPRRAGSVSGCRASAGAAAAGQLRPGFPAHRRRDGRAWPGRRQDLRPLPATERVPAGHPGQHRRDSALLSAVLPRSAATHLAPDRRVWPGGPAHARRPGLADRGHWRGDPAPAVGVTGPEPDMVGLRGRDRKRCGGRPVQGGQARRRGRDRPRAPADRPELSPGAPVPERAGHHPRGRRPSVPAGHAAALQPDPLCAA
jgi:hypothetical protein